MPKSKSKSKSKSNVTANDLHDIETLDDIASLGGISSDKASYCDLVIYFKSSSARQVLLPVSRAGLNGFESSLKAGGMFASVQTLDNRVVLIRKKVICDAYFSSNDDWRLPPIPYDESYIGYFPSSRFWERIAEVGHFLNSKKFAADEEALSIIEMIRKPIICVAVRNETIPADLRKTAVSDEEVHQRLKLFCSRANDVVWHLIDGRQHTLSLFKPRDMADVFDQTINGRASEFIALQSILGDSCFNFNLGGLDYVEFPKFLLLKGLEEARNCEINSAE